MSSSQPTIEQIETTVFRLPMRGALQWGASSRMAEARHVLVRVRLSDGAEGYAEAPPRPTIYGETATTICAVIAEEFAPRVAGMAVSGEDDDEGASAGALSPAMLRIQKRLHEVKNNQTARGAIDIAIHDAAAQSGGASLADRLGATRERVRVSYILGIGERDVVLEEAARVVAQGVRVLKVKVGRDWQDDVAAHRGAAADAWAGGGAVCGCERDDDGGECGVTGWRHWRRWGCCIARSRCRWSRLRRGRRCGQASV